MWLLRTLGFWYRTAGLFKSILTSNSLVEVFLDTLFRGMIHGVVVMGSPEGPPRACPPSSPIPFNEGYIKPYFPSALYSLQTV